VTLPLCEHGAAAARSCAWQRFGVACGRTAASPVSTVRDEVPTACTHVSLINAYMTLTNSAMVTCPSLQQRLADVGGEGPRECNQPPRVHVPVHIKQVELIDDKQVTTLLKLLQPAGKVFQAHQCVASLPATCQHLCEELAQVRCKATTLVNQPPPYVPVHTA